MTRELDVGDVRLVLRIEDPALLNALDTLLPRPARAGVPSEQLEVELRIGPATSIDEDLGLTVDLEAGELPASLRVLMGAALDRRGGAILHGAAAVVDGRAVLCIAPSEGGKTTLCGKLAGRVPVLSDETVALRLDGPFPRIAGTFFWSGPPLPTASGLFPLAAICFLRKGGVSLLPLDRPTAISELLQEWHLPERNGGAIAALTLAEQLVSKLPAFELHSTLESDPLPLLRSAIEGVVRRAS